MSDDRFAREPGDDADEANAQGERPYLDVPPPSTRPAKRQPFWQDSFVTAEEIKAFVQREYPETVKPKKRLIRPASWTGEEPARATEPSDAYEPPDEGNS